MKHPFHRAAAAGRHTHSPTALEARGPESVSLGHSRSVRGTELGPEATEENASLVFGTSELRALCAPRLAPPPSLRPPLSTVVTLSSVSNLPFSPLQGCLRLHLGPTQVNQDDLPIKIFNHICCVGPCCHVRKRSLIPGLKAWISLGPLFSPPQ